jgi:hypothetical protein
LRPDVGSFTERSAYLPAVPLPPIGDFRLDGDQPSAPLAGQLEQQRL